MNKALIKFKRQQTRGRGSIDNPNGRFESLRHEKEDSDWQNLADEISYGQKENNFQLRTQIIPDTNRSIISTNDSPDVGMETTLNPYRGCEHGCIYCYARPGHEYLGLSAGLDFETKIFAKLKAPQLLAQELRAKKWHPKTIFFSGVTDCYQPVERELELTRQCLQVLQDFRNPTAIITKNRLVTRDIDILSEMASWYGAYVTISVTSLDGHLSRKMEPRASQPYLRLQTVEQLSAAGIPVGVMIGPVVPGLTDHEIPNILKAAAEAGARSAHYTMLRLPYSIKDHFAIWLEEHFPDRAAKVLSHIKDVRGGKLYDSAFGTRMRGEGNYADQIADMMTLFKKRYNLNRGIPSLCTNYFRRHARDDQLSLF
jgi:DNA repair photolyase